MSLLEKIRGGTESGAMKIVLAIVVVVFVFWGVGSNSGDTTQVVAKVNGERITSTRFQKALRDAARSYQHTLSEEEQEQLGRQVLNQMILEELLLQEASRLGLHVSDEEVARTILEIPAFKDESGAFSKDLYARSLKRTGSSPGQFEENLRRQLLVSRLQGLVYDAVAVSEEDVRTTWEQINTRLDLQVLRVPALAFYDDVKPSAEELEAFATEHAAEVHARYQELYASRYHTPARARLRSVLLLHDVEDTTEAELRERMEAIKVEAEAGADFAELARKHGEDLSAETGGDLGLVRFDELEPAVAEAVFGTEELPRTEPGLRGPVETARGLQLFQVTEVLPEQTTPEDEVREALALEILQRQRAPALAEAFAQEMRQAWVAGELPVERLQAQELSPTDVEVSLANPVPPGLPPLEGLPEALAATTGPTVLDRVFAEGEQWFVVRVRDRQEPDSAMAALELPMVREQFEGFRRAEFLQSWRNDLLSRAEIWQRPL